MLRVPLLTLLVVVGAAVGLYLYGRLVCPPPDWWVRLFVPAGDFACVQ